ncbi:hypothetical protein C8Q80DRAFT_879065 [Daedaleopsis nitida]|nr:hypothetical protein C8Q80DRAFT_879065 [Daedaleopsis nitida]
MEEFEVVVIGAGWFGLAAAKTYIQLHSACRLLVLESASTVGGVWAQSRLYPGLKSNNMLGTYEYPDFPMDFATFGVSPGEHIPGPTVHKYLAAYAEHFNVHPRIRFNTHVDDAQKTPEGWTLRTTRLDTGEQAELLARRLVVATGLTSDPNLPSFTDQDSFRAPIFHSRDFAARAETIKTADSVTVLGGSKSAWDAAYAYATAGVPADMVIQKSGRGPVWMSPPYVTPLKKWLEKLVHMRFLTWFSPCTWGAEDGYGRVRRLLHGTWLGRKLVDVVWHVIGTDVLTLVGVDKHPETKKLKPWHPVFWTASGLGILNYPTDFFEFVREGVIRVHIADVERLSEHTVHLSNGEALDADALICATGWHPTPPIKFLPPESAAELGLPHYSPTPDPLVAKADAAILQEFPRLKDQPDVPVSVRTKGGERAPNEPFRLYRFMVPPSTLADRTIAFAGMVSTLPTSTCAHAQALWIAAYFDGKLERARMPGTDEEARWTTVLHSQFGKWRYPCGYGPRLPDFAFDALPYLDMLLRDMGLETRRKKGWLADMFEPYGPEDYEGLVGEWAAKHGVAM